jgi:hypothetical protein
MHACHSRVCDYVLWGNPYSFCHAERSEASGPRRKIRRRLESASARSWKLALFGTTAACRLALFGAVPFAPGPPVPPPPGIGFVRRNSPSPRVSGASSHAAPEIGFVLPRLPACPIRHNSFLARYLLSDSLRRNWLCFARFTPAGSARATSSATARPCPPTANWLCSYHRHRQGLPPWPCRVWRLPAGAA